MSVPSVAVGSRPYNCRYCLMGYLAEGHPTKALQDAGLDVTDLQKGDAVRSNILSYLLAKDPLLFTGFGHGNTDVFTDDAEQVVFDLNNVELMRGRIVRLLSCLTAQELGPAMIAAGAVAYLGYAVEWTWIQDDQAIDPYLEKYGEGFYKSADADLFSLAAIKTVGTAYQDGLNTYQYWIDRWRASSDPYAGDVIAWLLWDKEGYRAMGDMSATVGPRPVNKKLVELAMDGYKTYSKLVEVEPAPLGEMEVIGVREELEIGRSYIWNVTDKETAAPLADAEVYMDSAGGSQLLGKTDQKGDAIVTIPNPLHALVASTVKVEVSRVQDPASARYVGYALDIPLPDAWWTNPLYILGTVTGEFSKELSYDLLPHIAHTLTTSVSALVPEAKWHMKVTIDGRVKADQDIGMGERVQATWIPGGQPQPAAATIRISKEGYIDWTKQVTIVPPGENEFLVEPDIPEKVVHGAMIAFTVKDRATGAPLQGVAVMVDKAKVTETDINGKANLVL